MKKLRTLLMIGVSIIASSAQAAPLAPANLPDLVEKILPGVVNISSSTVINYRVPGWDDFLRHWGVPTERKQTSLGSGFIIDKDEGYVLTNNHVIEQSDEVVVTLNDKRQFSAKIIGKDDKMDLALLQIREKTKRVPAHLVAVPLGNSDSVRIAEPVFAVGNPFGLQHTVTMGIISAKNRTIGLGPFDNFLQTDASINPGNSGGPLFNLRGEVVGINTVIFSKTGQSGGLGFAIPANEAKNIIADLKRYGRVPRPWLGILGEKITPAHQRYYELPVNQGILIYNMVERGPAEKSGIRLGDIIVALDSKPVEDLHELEKLLFTHKPTETAAFTVRRGSRTIELKIKLQELPRINNLPQGIL